MKQRLDAKLAAQLDITRSKAAALILAGQVTADGQPARKPGQPVADDARLTVASPPPVSRAAGKLAPALDRWPITVKGRICLDVGASTGGFTETLLDRGARKIVAVDVGTGQLDWKLRNDPRVISLEKTDIRTLVKLPAAADLATVDVSFISLRQVLPALAKLLPPGSPVIALFKPQFEVGKQVANRYRGVVTDPAVIREALEPFQVWATEHGWKWRANVAAAVTGRRGNREQVIWLTTPAD